MRRLNSLATKDAYPLMRIDDLLRWLCNQQWFSTMDLTSGYWQLCGMRWSRCLAYMDDVYLDEGLFRRPSRDWKGVLARLSDFGLQLKAKKCTFMQTEVIFLGHIVGRTGLACDPANISAVRNWHAPDKVKAVRQFVGFVGYYRRFVKRLCGTGGTSGGTDAKRGTLCLDKPTVEGV